MARTSSKPKSSEVVDNNQVSKEPVLEKVNKSKKVAKVEDPVVVSASVPVVESSASASASASVPVEELQTDITDIENSINAQSTEFFAKLNQLSTLISSLKTEYRVIEKKWSRELKLAQKLNTKRKRKSVNRAPSGFVKPTKISDELAKFLEKPSGSEMARTDVTREINKYIRNHNLQDKENGRKINPDSKLASLLKLKKTDELTYFNLQRYMSPHFSKAVKEVVATA